MQKQSGFRWFFIPLIILMFECVIYYKMFFYSGYIQWGNFVVPLKQNLFGNFQTTTWDPYAYSGIPQEIPWLTVLGDYTYILFFIFGGYWSMNFAVKLYILLSTFAAAYSFYFLTGRFVRSQISRTIATIFFLLSPALLQQIGLGNFGTFFIYAIYFISVSMLSISYSAEGHKRHYFLFLSVFLLSLTVLDLQLFYLGVPLYFLFMFYFLIIEKRRFTFEGFLAYLRNFLLGLVLIVLFSMPLILTSLFGAFNLMPSSSVANPLNNFIVYSTSISDLLLMNPFHNILPSTMLIGPLASTSVLLIWDVSTFLLVLIILASGFVMRDRRILFWILVIFLATLLGSGYLSPVSYLTVFLYEHMPGYQILNASYFWGWIIITPLYAIILAILFERIILYLRDSKIHSIKKSSVKWRMKRILRLGAKGFLLTISVLIILLIVFPLMGQGFYGNGNSGIHQDGVPSSYGKLTIDLKNLVGNSNAGVAYFTPDNYVYFGSSTNGVSQPLLTYATVRSPGIPSYGAPPVVSNNFFYWLYTEFYLNETHDVAQLFSIMGIKYFVTLNGVISASSLYIANSENATRLMQYQKYVKLICSNPDYSLFESTLNVDMANSVQGFMLMSGNYNSLSEAAALGINISKIVPVFTEDIHSSDFNFFLDNTTSMVLSSSSSLLTLAIDKYTNSSDTIDPLSFTDNYYYSPYQGWMSSTGLETSNNNYILFDPYPFAITATNKSMSSNFITGTDGNYTMFAQVLLSQPNSMMRFTIDGRSVTIDSNKVGFQWVKIPFNSASTDNNLSITSLNGLNGIQRIVILKSGLVGNETGKIYEFIHSRSIPVLYLYNNRSSQTSDEEPTLNSMVVRMGYNLSGDTGYVPFVLTNSQNSATSDNFQQLIKIDWSKYASYINANVSNVRFYSSAEFTEASELYAWIETNNSTNAKSSNVWMNLANNTVPADGILIIYMTFLPKSASWGLHWGLAPQLSNPYGRYDNGAKVFTGYWNFTGTNLSVGTQTSGGGWSTYIQNKTYGSETNYAKQDNGLTISFPSGNKNYDFFWASNFGIDSVFDWYGIPYTPSNHSAPQALANNGGWGFGLGNEGNPEGQNPVYGIGSYGLGTVNYYLDGNPVFYSNWTVNPPVKGVYTVGIYSHSIQATLNYSNPVSSNVTSSSPYNVGWGFGYGISNGTYHIQWARVRMSPPNGIMPLVSVLNISLINEINNASQRIIPEKLENNPNGYTIHGIFSNITLVRYGYFPGIVETDKGFSVYPIMGDLSFVLVSHGDASTANFVSIDYNLLLCGVSVYALAIAVPTVYFVTVFRREKKSGGKKMIDIQHKLKLKFHRFRK